MSTAAALSLGAQYAAFAAKHAHLLRTLETVVNSAAWLAPEGEAADFALEAASAFIGVLGVVNEHVTPATDGQTACTRPRGGPAGSRAPWPLYVTILHQLEVLLEISAERALGADGKWSVLAGVEAVKALLRLAVLRGSDARILINDLAPSSAPRALPWAPHAQLAAAEAEQCSRERAERTLRALAAFRRRRAPSACAAPEVLRAMSGTDAGCTLPPGARAPACIPRPPRLLQPDAAQQQRRLLAGEFLRLVRPVVYCLAVRRYGRGSWRPWLASLALDLSSDGLLRRVPLNAEERAEVQRRRALLAYYLLFNPAYGVTVQPPLHALRRALVPVPVLGAVADRMTDLLDSTLNMHAYSTAL